MIKNKVEEKFLISDITGKVIGVFKDTFLGIYFLKITYGNIVDVSIYYIVFYLFYILCLYLVNKLQKINLIVMFRIGIFLNLLQCINLLVAQENIANYIIPFALFASIGNAFYYYPEQILIKRVNKNNDFQNYITKDQIIKYTISIILPIVLGYSISKNSYSLALIILIILIAISFIFSLYIKNIEIKHEKINLKRFLQNIEKNNHQELMKLLSIRSIFRGLSSFGVLSSLITILTYLVVKEELRLGSISSFITIISIAVIYLLNKTAKKKNISKIFIPISIIQSIMIIILTYCVLHFNLNHTINIGTISLSIGFLLILLYNIINGISNPIFETSNTIVYYECIDKQDIDSMEHSSYVFWFEIMINISRSIGYVVLIIASKIGFNLNVISILIVLFTLFYIGFAYILQKIKHEY